MSPLNQLAAWSVRYRDGEARLVLRAATPEEAIAAACRLLYENKIVEAIGCSAADTLIGPTILARFYRNWRWRRGLAAETETPPKHEESAKP